MGFEMESLDVESKEALAWVAGFFCGEGCVSVSRTETSCCGMVMIGQKERRPLELIHEILAVHGIIVSEPRYAKSSGVFTLTLNNAYGSEFLQLLLPYPIGKKHRKRAEVYLRMFPPGEHYRKRGVHRNSCFVEWVELQAAEARNEV